LHTAFDFYSQRLHSYFNKESEFSKNFIFIGTSAPEERFINTKNRSKKSVLPPHPKLKLTVPVWIKFFKCFLPEEETGENQISTVLDLNPGWCHSYLAAVRSNILPLCVENKLDLQICK